MGRALKGTSRFDSKALNHGDARTNASANPQPFSELARRAARSDCTILITGETGVGKGFLARWLHQSSARADRAYVPVNCGAIPETLIDSQLFGHVRGAFSGATRDHIGLVRAAEGGTLFLDEVCELPASAQMRLLRLLQEHEIQPVGHPRPIIVSVRIIAATNSDLHQRVREKKFREDLLFRLDIVRMDVRPLRLRPDELPGLLGMFNQEFAELYHQPPLEFCTDAIQLLTAYNWPGNIRELRTVIERLHVLAPDEPVTARSLAEIAGLDVARNDDNRPRALGQLRYQELLRVLEESGGCVARAAKLFGVHRSTIYRWLRMRSVTLPGLSNDSDLEEIAS